MGVGRANRRNKRRYKMEKIKTANRLRQLKIFSMLNK